MENMENYSDDRLYVAVGKDLSRSKSTLLWALHNSRGKEICILHVHEPSLWIPLMGTKFLASQLQEYQIREYRDIEREAMNKLLQSYSLICNKAGVQVSTSYIEMNSIEKGIIDLITRNGIGKLVMGAAADKYYTKKMMKPKSKKAIYVCQKAPSTCHIWFICKGNLVHTRESRLDRADIDVTSLISQASPSSGPVESNLSRSQSVMEEPNGQLHRPHSGHGYRSGISESPRVENLYLSPSPSSGPVESNFSRSQSVMEGPNGQLHRPHSRHGYRSGISEFENPRVENLYLSPSPSSGPVESNFSRSQSVMEGPNGQLHTPHSGHDYRSGISEFESPRVENLYLSPSPSSGPVESNFLRSQSVMEGPNGQLHRPHSGHGYRSGISESPRVENLYLSSSSSGEVSNRDEITGMRPFVSVHSHSSISSLSNVVDVSSLPHQIENHHRHSPPPSELKEGGMNDGLYDQLDQAIVEAENSRREAFEESPRRGKAEKDIIDVIHQGSGYYFSEHLHRRKVAEEALAWGLAELDMMKQQLNETIEELCDAKGREKSLEKQIAISERTVHELEQKMFSSVELLQKYKKERDELEKECENAIKVAAELKKKQSDEASSSSRTQYFFKFSSFEVEEATNYFDQSLKIWEEGCDSVYRGFLRHTQVAIKISQVPSDFEQEVSFLSKLRHPNLLTLFGACPEYSALIYEYLPNGTLEDRLNCKDNSPPLSWQTRIRIASELCSVLIFLHSCNPHRISHGDLHPSNILLDTNHVSKLCDFRLNRIFVQDKALKSSIFCCVQNTEGTLAYIDPEFVASQELTPESDVYSFGVILMRLLINKSARGIIETVQSAFDEGNLNNLLDHTAGDWPFVQVKQLAHLAIRCCDTNSKNRPDLAYEVSRVFETMLVSCGATSARLSSDDHHHIPHYFVCPIFQETMEDPHVAADGFTYELEALRGWLDSGHDTSPMTNLKLPHHNLVPNRALRSAIQEWQQNK